MIEKWKKLHPKSSYIYVFYDDVNVVILLDVKVSPYLYTRAQSTFVLKRPSPKPSPPIPTPKIIVTSPDAEFLFTF